jgi:hypothetical protein
MRPIFRIKMSHDFITEHISLAILSFYIDSGEQALDLVSTTVQFMIIGMQKISIFFTE